MSSVDIALVAMLMAAIITPVFAALIWAAIQDGKPYPEPDLDLELVPEPVRLSQDAHRQAPAPGHERRHRAVPRRLSEDRIGTR